MSIKPDMWIRKHALAGMITPFTECLKTEGVISYGLSSYGYDLRVAPDWQVFAQGTDVVDPKRFDPGTCVHSAGPVLVIPAHGFALARTVEWINMPRNVLGIVLGKSTYARVGLVVNCTPIEPGWFGQITLELSNTTPRPVRVYGGEGIAQLLFFEGEPCEVSYADRKGKYQKQQGITYAK